MGAMAAVKVEQQDGCAENGKHLAASSPLVSEGGSYGGHAGVSPVVSSPADAISGRRRTSGPVRRAKGGWTSEEDETLRKAVDAFKGKSWKKIAEFFPDRTEVQCLHRWQKVLNPELIKGPWTQEEDDIIINIVKKQGPKKWSVIAKSLHGRIGKQCRERWHNHLDPQIRKQAWTVEEEHVLVNAHRFCGNKWAEIAKLLPGRTDNSIKNHWNSSLRKRLDEHNTRHVLPVPAHVIHNDLKHVAKRPLAENHIDLNKEPNISLKDRSGIPEHSDPAPLPRVCSLKDTKGSSDFLSLSMPTAQPVTSCEASVADDSAVALAIQGLKMASVHLKGVELNFVCEKGLEINSLNDKGMEIDHITDNMGRSRAAKPEGETANNGCESSLQNEAHSFGSLCYQIPKLVDIVPAHSPVFSTHNVLEHSGDGIHSPIGYTTPSSPKDREKSDQLSVESILKSAAENFPSTPSILRRRKREKPTPAQDSDLKIDILKSDSFHTPIGKCTTDSPHSFKTATFLSLGPPDDQGLPAAFRSFDVSPPYRRRSKKMAVLKTVEKHLDFSSDGMDICDTTGIVKYACRNSESTNSCTTGIVKYACRNSESTNSCTTGIVKSACRNSESTNSCTRVSNMQDKKMDGHMIALEILTKDFAHTTKLDAT